MRTETDVWSSVAFRVSCSALNSAAVEDALRVFGSGKFKRVDPPRRPPSNPQIEECLWVLDSGLSPSKPLEDHLQTLLSVVTSNADGLLKIKDRCRLDFFCGFSSRSGQGGFGIDSSSLRRMGQLNIDLIIELYSLSNNGMGNAES
jgi:hypothetical protein